MEGAIHEQAILETQGSLLEGLAAGGVAATHEGDLARAIASLRQAGVMSLLTEIGAL